MKRKILFVLAVSVIISALWSDELFTNTVDLEPYIYYMSGFTVGTITPRQTAELSDGSFVVLAEAVLADGMLEQYAIIIVRFTSDGHFDWVRFLTDDPTIPGIGIVLNAWKHSYCLYVADEEIWVTGQQEWGIGISILAKYNLQGEHLDAITLSQGSELISIKSLKKAPNETFYAIGQSIVQYYKEMYLSQITSEGDTLWTYHNEDYEKVYDMTVIPDNRILITAQTRDPGLVGDPIPRVICFDVETRSIIWETDFPTGAFDLNQTTISDEIDGFYYCGISYFDDYELYSLISKIDASGEMQECFLIPWDYYVNYDTPYNIVDNETGFIITLKVDNNTDIVKVNENGAIQWGISQENCGEGVDVLAKTTDGNFVVVSTPDGEKIKLTKFDADGNFTHTNEEVVPVSNYNLKVYPNPMNYGVKQRGLSQISFDLNTLDYQDYCIEVYSIKGELLYHTEITNPKCGLNMIQWYGKGSNGSLLSSGVYLCCLKGNKNVISSTRTVILK